MNGYIKVRIMSAGRYVDCWQKIENGIVVGYVNDNNEAVELPALRDEMVLSNELHFAPNVPRDPDAPAMVQAFPEG